MTKRQRTVAGVGSVAWLPVFLTMIAVLASTSGELSGGVEALIFVALMAMFVLGLVALVLLTRHIYVESGLSTRGQLFWTTILFVFNLYAAPIYWLRHVRTREAEPA